MRAVISEDEAKMSKQFALSGIPIYFLYLLTAPHHLAWNMEIGSKIKALRIVNGLTQEELADRAELSKGFISQNESPAFA